MKILDISKKISDSLGINEKTLEDILRKKLTDKELEIEFTDSEKLQKIEKLFESDAKILNVDSQIEKQSTKDSFTKLKDSLGKLQILVLINNIKKSKNTDEILDSFIKVFNDKIESVNTILEDNFMQSGGNKNNYFIKYLKYKKKYLNI